MGIQPTVHKVIPSSNRRLMSPCSWGLTFGDGGCSHVILQPSPRDKWLNWRSPGQVAAVAAPAPERRRIIVEWRSRYGGFHEWGVPPNGLFVRENPTKMDDLGIPLFQETTIYTQPSINAWIPRVVDFPTGTRKIIDSANPNIRHLWHRCHSPWLLSVFDPSLIIHHH